MTRNPPDPQRVAEARRLSASADREETAALLGVHPSTISRWVPGARPRGRRRRGDVDDAQILMLRDEDGLSWREIAVRVGMSRSGVRRRYDDAARAGQETAP